MVDWLADVRAAVRGWKRTPMVATTIVVTLSLGIGLTAAIFAFADGYLFRPLPFPGAERTYIVKDPNARIALLQRDADILRESALGGLGFVEWQVSRRVRGSSLLIGERPVAFFAYAVSPRFRDTLPLPLVIGRDFDVSDYRDSDVLPAWISYRFWMREFGGDRAVLGRTYRFAESAEQRIVIVGVLGPTVASFDLNNQPPDAVVPAAAPTVATNSAMRLAFPLVRLPQNLSVGQAEAAMGAILQQAAPSPDGKARVIRLTPLIDSQIAGGRPTARVLFAGALLILLLSAINLTHLLMARGVGRANEIAARVALGASRWRITRLFLTESAVLGLAGVSTGLTLGFFLARIIEARIPQLPTGARNLALVPMIFDSRVVIVAATLGAIVTLIGGLWPAWQARHRSLSIGTRSASGVASVISSRGSNVILASELAVATVVVIGTLFIGTGIWAYLHQPLGYEYRDRFRVAVTTTGRTPLAESEFAAVEGALIALPGVSAAGPYRLKSAAVVDIPGRAFDGRRVGASIALMGYFETWGMRLHEGRWFAPREFAGAEDVAVIDRALAGMVWPEASAIGQRIRVGGRDCRVVGVVETWRDFLSRPPLGRVFVPGRSASEFPEVTVWAPGASADALSTSATAALASIMPGASVRVVPVTLENLFLRDVGEAEFQAPIVAVFGVLAFALAAIGVFGLISFLVERRLREFGIRMALGAGAWDIRAAVMRRNVWPALVGIAMGVGGAYALESVVRASVFGWPSSQLQVIVYAAVSLSAVALVAASIPARRATRVDPAAILRAE
jgi:predicted permease